MNAHAMLRKAKEFIAAEGGEVAPLSIPEEDLNPDQQDDMSLSAEPLESTSVVYDVPYDEHADSDCSEFRFFEDGRQRTIQIGHIRITFGTNLVVIPVHFFIIGAAILERKARRLKVWKAPLIEQGIFVARSLVPNQSLLEEFEKAGLKVIDSESHEGGPSDYYDMRRRALHKAKDRRLAVEQDLISQWRKDSVSEDSFLVIDGTLMNLRDEQSVDRCVGVSKSFSSRYFDVSLHNRIMEMSECQRSWTFRFHAPDEDLRIGARERVSWYLRLREHQSADPEFGLIRVEVAKKYIEQAQSFAERVSRSLLSERLPTAYPAPRWDKNLYPIRTCEAYLSSVMPSVSTVAATMKG